MRVTLFAFGSRGDVQPYVALGVGLVDAGHEVVVATHAEFEPLVRRYGLNYSPVGVSPTQFLQSDTGQALQASAGNPVQYMLRLREAAESAVEEATRDCLAASENADMILSTILGFFIAYSVGEQLGIPTLPALMQPDAPTKSFAHHQFPPAPSRSKHAKHLYNRLTHLTMANFFWRFLAKPLNRARKTILHLPPLKISNVLARKRNIPHLYGYSRYVLPKPPDWRANQHVTGYWFLDKPADWQPPQGLEAFLAAGPPPVYVGFGSMQNKDPQEVLTLTVEALAMTQQRGVLLGSNTPIDYSTVPETVFFVQDVPHDWLFPQMAAVVHHCGAGTMAAGLRAGVPAVGVPFFTDQPFWARRLAHLKVGTPPIPRKDLTAERLATAINAAINTPSTKKRARELGTLLAAETGVIQAVEILQRINTSQKLGANSSK